MTEPYTPDRPMYPNVRVTRADYEDEPSVIEATARAIYRKCGHNAADWFRRTATEFESDDELWEFIRSTVRVS